LQAGGPNKKTAFGWGRPHAVYMFFVMVIFVGRSIYHRLDLIGGVQNLIVK